ncbi:MAG: hypothetical protein QM772_02020 [Ottowia sp.]|uniref:hypothetical protein n=1 Tax=Ottowia sp. TaxID=1898956 RepID=UPI0039E36218
MVEREGEGDRIFWSLRSNNGRSRIECTLVGRSEKSAALICRIDVAGEFWHRGGANIGPGMTNDFYVTLPQVLLDIRSVNSLYEHLIEWQRDKKSFIVSLGVLNEGDQKVEISIGRDENLIYSIEKPACTFTYACGSSMQGKWSFVVDQSCIRLCAEDIGEFVRGVAG